jgi:hypothetical protein
MTAALIWAMFSALANDQLSQGSFAGRIASACKREGCSTSATQSRWIVTTSLIVHLQVIEPAQRIHSCH